jgi:hypothetical protein
MATERRPLRPAARVPAPAPARPAPAAPAARSATARVPAAPPPAARPAAKAATARVASVHPPAKTATARVTSVPTPPKKTTRIGRPSPTSRGSAAAPAKNNTPVIIGVAVGAVVLLGILAFALSGGNESKKTSEPAAKKAPSASKDVSQLEREGMSKCSEGVRLIKAALGSNDKDGLERGVALISEGNGLLDKAQSLGNTGGYDTKDVNQTLYLARKKLQELRN